MKTSLIILAPHDCDLSELARIHNSASVKKYISISDNYFDYVTNSKGVTYYKIITDNKLIGGIHCEVDKEIMYLSICVDEPYRRLGIAETALRQLFANLTDDITNVEVSIDKTNNPSLHLFQKLGFVPISEEDDLIIYRLSLH